MSFEDRVRQALQDPSWDLPPWPDPETRVRAALLRRRRTTTAAALGAVVIAGVVGVAVWQSTGGTTGSERLTPVNPATASATPTATASSETPATAATLVRDLGTTLVGTAANGALYVSFSEQSNTATPTMSRVARIDRETGATARSAVLDGPPGRPVAAGQTLLVPAGTWLYRLDPTTLAVLGRTALGGAAGTAAVTGTSAWVTVGGQLVHVQVAEGAVVGRVTVSSYPISVSAGDDGRLYVGVGSSGGDVSEIQQRDAATAGLLTRSARLNGISTPIVVGTAPGGVWVHVATGMQATVERLAVPGWAVSATYPAPLPNSSATLLGAGRLWVDSQQSVTCADAVTGAVRSTVASATNGGRTRALLAVDSRYLYLWTDPDTSHGGVARVPVSSACP